MRDATDAQLFEMGWSWVKRGLDGRVLAVTIDAGDAAMWMQEHGHKSVTRLRKPIEEGEQMKRLDAETEAAIFDDLDGLYYDTDKEAGDG